MLDKKFNIENEKEIQKLWEEKEAYKFKNVDERPIYSVDTPPPTVSGKLHVGHIFSFTQSEMLVRYHRLKGENVYYPFGFDDNGLPTERLVEREENIFAKDLPRSEFIKKCNITKDKYIKEFQNLFKRLGISADWNLSYDTINDLSRKISQRSFIDLVKKGKAYRKEMPVLWCPCCQTSIAQAELENKEIKSYFNYINFEVDNKNLEIATTRPEFLGGCVAIFVNPNDERYKGIIGKSAIVPLYNNNVPIIGDDKVSIDKGTGAVMCCTFGDQTDMEWQKEYNLPVKKVMQADGTINPEIAIIGGMKTIDARMKIIDELQKNGLLVKSEKIEHSVSTHERCGNAIEIINSPQWYIDILNIKDELIKAADEINWHPESMKSRYLDWVNNLKWDWCISRQRYFGVPFPVWYCKECGDVILPEDKELPLNPLEHNPQSICKCGCKEFIPEMAVMDTWATSSVSPFINMKYGEDDEKKFLYPMSMRSHAHEIIRTWTFYSIVKSLYHTGQVPWKDLMISGFVLAKKGEKISKSKNNAKMSPNDLLDTYGADMIRYWTASNKLGTDTWFDTKDIEGSKRFMNKLWNSAKFVDMHIKNIDLNEKLELQSIDKWLISKCHETFEKYQQQMENYEMGLARQEIDKFFWNDLCDNYVEITKERLYNSNNKYLDMQKSAQQTLAIVFLEVLKMYSPFVPHITEYIYQELYKFKLNIELLSTSKFTTLPYEKRYIEFGEAMKKVVGDVRKYKTERNLSMKEPIEELKIYTSLNNIRCLKDSISDIQSCTHAEYIDIEKSDITEVQIIGEKNNDKCTKSPMQENSKVKKLVLKDK